MIKTVVAVLLSLPLLATAEVPAKRLNSAAAVLSEVMSAPDKKSYTEVFTAQIPMRRVGHAEEVADTVTFLLSDKAAYLTGVTVPVAGGLQL